jgi:hypothetical protein
VSGGGTGRKLFARAARRAGLSGTMYNRDTMREELEDLTEQYGDDSDFIQLMESELPNPGRKGRIAGCRGGRSHQSALTSWT